MTQTFRSMGTAFAFLAGITFCTAARADDAAMGAKSVPTDAEIAHIVVTANTIDVDAGKFAMSKTKNSEVKSFAQQMVMDHKAVNKQTESLAKKLGVKPKSNETSTSLKKDSKEEMAKLKKLSGTEFDREYVNHEVDYHQSVLDTIDEKLMPNAKNEELKAHISKVRPSIQAHLEHAKHLQSTLSKS